MTTFLAVLKDLWEFVCGTETKSVSVLPRVEVEQIATLPIQNIAAEKEVVKPQPVHLPSGAGEVGYVSAPKAAVFYRPVLTFDGVIKNLPFGTKVTVLSYEGRFARITFLDTTAFVLKDTITSIVTDVFPVLESGEIYSANHPDTKKIRTLLKDVFFTKELYLPLQAVEFVLYKLQLAGRLIDWPLTRPRLAGTWQQILKGKLGTQIGIVPKTGAILEYTKPDGTGFVAYTKAVHVDESIVIEGVGRLIEGEYREEPLSKAQWQALQPVWISIV